MLANCTQRQEARWEMQAFVTTATFTGCRLGILALSDPGYDGASLSPQLVWGAIMNQKGTMVEASGTSGKRTKFAVATPTHALSNATPPQPNNMVGYAAAVAILYCLQAPIALHETMDLSVTVMARCLIRCSNPIPGYALYQTPIAHTDHNVPEGAKPTWILNVAATPYNDTKPGASSTMYRGEWVKSHNGGAWLAGGYYMYFMHWGQAAPKDGVPSTNTTSSGYGPVTIYGDPKRCCVYTTDDTFPLWQDNDKANKRPKYFVTHVNPIHHSVWLVGFQLLEHAMMQARGDTGMVPHGAELCIRYNQIPTWQESFPKSTGSTIDLKFYLLYESEKPYPFGGPIYNAINENSSGLNRATFTSTFTQAHLPSGTQTTPAFHYNPLVAPQVPSTLTLTSSLPPLATVTTSLPPLPVVSTHSQNHTSSSNSANNIYRPSETSSSMEQLSRALGAMQLQLNTLISQVSATMYDQDEGCNCLGACSCPAARHSVEQLEELQPHVDDSGEDSDSTVEDDTEWDTSTVSDNTQAAQDHLAWLQQQQQVMEQAAQRAITIQRDAVLAMALQGQVPNPEPTAPPPPTPTTTTVSQCHSNWSSLISALRRHRYQ